jgi:hypothetical protein
MDPQMERSFLAVAYGYLPPRFFKDILRAFRAWPKAHRVTLTPR